MTRNGKDRLAAALGESYPRVWRGLGLESKNARNLPAIQDKKRTREDDRVGHPYPARRSREGTCGQGDMGARGSGTQKELLPAMAAI